MLAFSVFIPCEDERSLAALKAKCNLTDLQRLSQIFSTLFLMKKKKKKNRPLLHVTLVPDSKENTHSFLFDGLRSFRYWNVLSWNATHVCSVLLFFDVQSIHAERRNCPLVKRRMAHLYIRIEFMKTLLSKTIL